MRTLMLRTSLALSASATGLLLLVACGGGGQMSETAEGIPLGYSKPADPSQYTELQFP